jgi:prevent-host-death family protein
MLSKIPQFVSASELRQHLAKYLVRAKKEPVVISTDRGANASVLMSAAMYNTLLEAYEDMIDTRELTELVLGQKGKPMKWNRAKYGI